LDRRQEDGIRARVVHPRAQELRARRQRLGPEGRLQSSRVGQRFEYFASHEKLVDIIKTIKFVEKTHSAAIQLADFLAFYSRRHAEKCERERNAEAEHDEPLATMLSLFEPHRGILANDFFLAMPAPICEAVHTRSDAIVQGQGMHGSLSRSDTANFMAAIGPAFKRSFVDPAPVSNADIAPTLAHVLGLPLPTKGKLSGRVATEALKRGEPVCHARRNIVSAPSPKGLRTIVNMQYVGETPYFDAGGFAGRTLGLRAPGK
jgi:hypothetical protein